jgi:hypothetical protein
MRRRFQTRVLLQQRKGFLPRLLEQICIPYKVRNAKLRHAPLSESKKLSWPANAEIFFRNHKPVS